MGNTVDKVATPIKKRSTLSIMESGCLSTPTKLEATSHIKIGSLTIIQIKDNHSNPTTKLIDG
jgi:hypothetical protein